jgi:hypothetical protein
VKSERVLNLLEANGTATCVSGAAPNEPLIVALHLAQRIELRLCETVVPLAAALRLADRRSHLCVLIDEEKSATKFLICFLK